MSDEEILSSLISLTLNLIALAITVFCYFRFPTKRWRFIAFIVWLGISFVAGTALLVIRAATGGPLAYHFWIAKTVDLIGYLAVIATFWSHYRYYIDLGYG